jgi:hypothetical protein
MLEESQRFEDGQLYLSGYARLDDHGVGQGVARRGLSELIISIKGASSPARIAKVNIGVLAEPMSVLLRNKPKASFSGLTSGTG